MRFEGGCYCGGVRYAVDGEPMLKAECHCRECQYITGGGPNFFVAVPVTSFSYTRGAAKPFARRDLDKPVTREFCPECGTHLMTRSQSLPAIIVKVGTMDDPTLYGGPDLAIHMADKQSFHVVKDGLPCFERRPSR